METRLRDELNEQLKAIPRSADDYETASVLVICWEDADMPGFRDEAHQVSEIFKVNFGFHVEPLFLIPTSQSQLTLERAIIDFILTRGARSSLLIIHYGGHGDEDDDRVRYRKRQSVWAARAKGGSTLDWFLIQPKLNDADADVVLLLDCCYGAQAARGRELPSRVELLAASAMGVKAAPPGPKSFTTALIQELKAAASSPAGFTVSEIHRHLSRKEAGLVQSPFYVEMGISGRRSIRLKPLQATAKAMSEDRPVSTLLTFQASLRDSITKNTLPELVNWLRNDAPPSVSTLTVEKIVLTTERAYDFIFETHTRGHSGFPAHELGSRIGHDLKKAWESFVVANARSGLSLSSQAASEPPLTMDMVDYQGSIGTFIQDLEKNLQILVQSMEQSILAAPRLHDQEALLRAIDDQLMQDLGFSEMLRMRTLALFPPDNLISPQSDYNAEELFTRQKQLIPLASEDLPDLGRVLVEYKKYGLADAEDPTAMTLSYQRISQLAEILKAEKSYEFRTLRCLKWFHLPEHHTYGLAFANPPMAQCQPLQLRKVIKSSNPYFRPSLGERFAIALHIGKAIHKWHSVNWVHQSVASHNIVFFQPEGQMGINYSSPYLCGFEYARPNDAPSTARYVENFDVSIYSHPDRQGVPSKSHKKKHDLYSYGVVLLEIGFWRLAADLFPKEFRTRVTAENMKKTLTANVRTRLAHHMGRDYCTATLMCLEEDFDVTLDDAVESHLTAMFNSKVLGLVANGKDLK